VTSFFGIKGAFLRFSRKRQYVSLPNFFSGLGNDTKLNDMKILKCAYFFIGMITLHCVSHYHTLYDLVSMVFMFKVKCLRVVVDKTFVTLVLLDAFFSKFFSVF